VSHWNLHIQYHLRNCRQLLNTVTLVLTWRHYIYFFHTHFSADFVERYATSRRNCVSVTIECWFQIRSQDILACRAYAFVVVVVLLFESALVTVELIIYTHTHTHTRFLCIAYSSKDNALHRDNFSFMDNSGKVWLIRTSILYTHYDIHTFHPHTTQHSMVIFGYVRVVRLKINCSMRDIEHARVVPSGTSHHAEQTLRSLLCEACHTSIYSIKSQGWQVYFWTFKAVTHTEE